MGGNLQALRVAVFARAFRDCMGDISPRNNYGHYSEMKIIESAVWFLERHYNNETFINICIYNGISREEVLKIGRKTLASGVIPKCKNGKQGGYANGKNTK